MTEGRNITKQEERTVEEAVGIMRAWLDAHKGEAPFCNPGFWGIEEAVHQIEHNIGYMREGKEWRYGRREMCCGVSA